MNEVEEELASVKGELQRVNGMIDIKQSQINDQNNRLRDLETKVSKINTLIFGCSLIIPQGRKITPSNKNPEARRSFVNIVHNELIWIDVSFASRTIEYYKLSHKREWNTKKYSASASHIQRGQRIYLPVSLATCKI